MVSKPVLEVLCGFTCAIKELWIGLIAPINGFGFRQRKKLTALVA